MESFKEIFESTGVDVDDTAEVACDDLAVKMMDFIETNVDLIKLNDEQSDVFDDILIQIENIEEETEESELDEAAKIRKKISPADKRKRKIDYRNNRASLKMKAKKLRKTSKYKKYTKKSKRMAKRGKTSTGKRQSKFI